MVFCPFRCNGFPNMLYFFTFIFPFCRLYRNTYGRENIFMELLTYTIHYVIFYLENHFYEFDYT